MRCPSCKGDTKVINTVTLHEGKPVSGRGLAVPEIEEDCILRRRKCKVCGTRFSTAETTMVEQEPEEQE